MFNLVIAFCTVGTTDCSYYQDKRRFKDLTSCQHQKELVVNSKDLDKVARILGKYEILGTCYWSEVPKAPKTI